MNLHFRFAWIWHPPARTRPAVDAKLRLDGALLVRMSSEVTEAVGRAERYVELRERLVEVNPEVRGGEPVITETRMPVRSLARLIELGETLEVLREDYAHLPEESFELCQGSSEFLRVAHENSPLGCVCNVLCFRVC